MNKHLTLLTTCLLAAFAIGLSPAIADQPHQAAPAPLTAVGNKFTLTQVVPGALATGIGLYGFTVPRTDGGIAPLEDILPRPASELNGDDRNIAVLARAFHGTSIESVRSEKGGFTEPAK